MRKYVCLSCRTLGKILDDEHWLENYRLRRNQGYSQIHVWLREETFV